MVDPLRVRVGWVAVGVAAMFAETSCVTGSDRDRAWVAEEVAGRVGAHMAATPRAEAEVPPGVALDDGLDEDEAAALALYNHPQFEAALAELDLSRAALVSAGLLKNPVLSVLIPWGPKQLEATLHLAVDALWLHASREAAARRDVEAVAEKLVAEGLALVRDTRLAFLDAELAARRAEVAREQARRATERFEQVESQVAAGDVAPAESWGAAQGRDQRMLLDAESRMQADATFLVLRERLAGGFGLGPDALRAASGDAEALVLPDRGALVRTAYACRPDLRAAEIRVEAAAARVDLSREQLAAVSLILDANGDGDHGFEAGPGVALELPLFDQGQGRRALADAELAAALAQCQALRRRVAEDVERRALEFEHARELARRVRESTLAGLQRQLVVAEERHAVGDGTRLEILDAELALADEQLHLKERETAARRARAHLEFALGRRLSVPEAQP